MTVSLVYRDLSPIIIIMNHVPRFTSLFSYFTFPKEKQSLSPEQNFPKLSDFCCVAIEQWGYSSPIADTKQVQEIGAQWLFRPPSVCVRPFSAAAAL